MHIPQFLVRKVKTKTPPSGTTVSSSADPVVKHLLFFFHLPPLLPSMSASSSGRLTQMAVDMPPAAAKVPFHLWSQWAHWKEIVSSGAFWEGLQLAQHGSPVYPSTNFCAQRSGILWLAALTTCLPANLWELGIENPLTEITWNRPAFFKKKKLYGQSGAGSAL